ncbi:MAG: hypothetical protein WC789_09250 [Lentisphaeria bacterium]
MATTDYKELATQRFTRYELKDNRWSGRRVYSSSLTNLNDNVTALGALSWTVGGVAMTPRYLDINDTPADYPGGAIITLHYSFGDNPYAYNSAEATLSISGFGTPYKMRYGLTAAGVEDVTKPIETEPDSDGKYWKPLGDNTGLRSEATFIIRTADAQSTISWATYEAWIGKKTTTALTANTQTMAAAGELLLLRIEIPEYYFIGDNDPVVPLRFVLQYRRGGFPDVSVGQYRQELHKRYVYHETDDPTAANRIFVDEDDGTALAGTGDVPPAGAKWRIVSLERQIDTATRARYATADMSTLFTRCVLTAG